MSKLRSFKKKINQKTAMIALMAILVISSFIVINKYDLISRAIGYFAAINNGYTKEVKSIELKTTGYDTGTEGALKITKSAEWTNLNEATVKIKVESNPIEDNKDKDIIFLLDISSSFGEGDVLAKFQSNFINASKEIIDYSSNNRIALFSFSTNPQMIFGFTRDKTKIESSLDNLQFGGSTNFYKALKAIEQYLTKYTFQGNKELHIIFISDGYANEGRGYDEVEYKILKEKYPELIIDGIREGSGPGKFQEQYDIKRISDRQYYGDDYKGDRNPSITLKDMIIDAALSKSYYLSINVTDYINPTYFTYKSSSSYYGTSSVTTENGVEKVTWNLNDGGFKSGYAAELEIKLDLNSAYHGVEAYFPTNNNLIVYATDTHISNVSGSTTDTPVLQSWFEVNYASNTPTGCSAAYNKTEKYFPFSNVTIKGSNLTCDGWVFKGWEIDDPNITRINTETFVMPLRNVTIGAEWRQLSINKSMDGTINERSTLYEIIADQAKSDIGINLNSISSDTNGKGVYTHHLTTNNTYPIRYFRGNIDNNNVIFGNKCWKIYRTTATGGIKMIYNGTPTSGKCTAAGSNTVIGQTEIVLDQPYEKQYGSLASNLSYTYDVEYPTKIKYMGEDNLSDYADFRVSAWVQDASEYYATSFTVENGKFKLAGTITKTTYSSSMIGRYMIPNGYTGYLSSNICYVVGLDSYGLVQLYCFDINNYNEARGQNLYTYFLNKTQNKTWLYGNDVTYSNGVYTLQNTVSLKPYYYGDYIPSISKGYHYTCFSTNNTCSIVNYVFSDMESYLEQSYIELSGGKKIEDALNEMYIAPGNNAKSGLATVIDTWYANNMTPYTYMLEDARWCNTKYSENNQYDLGGWQKDGDSKNFLYSKSYIDVQTNYGMPTIDNCRDQDAYTVSTANGNGYLTYPVGTLTAEDLKFAGAVLGSTTNTNFYLYNGLSYWTMSPAYFHNLYGYFLEMQSSGKINYTYENGGLNYKSNVRPAISLKPGVFASSGNGTPNNPYIIEME